MKRTFIRISLLCCISGYHNVPASSVPLQSAAQAKPIAASMQIGTIAGSHKTLEVYDHQHKQLHCLLLGQGEFEANSALHSNQNDIERKIDISKLLKKQPTMRCIVEPAEIESDYDATVESSKRSCFGRFCCRSNSNNS